jgi:pimeloyl-ACP methyl ester carboxylesterase
MARQLRVGGQTAWEHDEGHAAGIFHTFDALDVGARFPARKVHIFLPRGWDRHGRRFPLVVMHDGDTAFWRGGFAGKTWDVAGELSRRVGRHEPAIVAAVHPIVRDHEYTHADWASGRRPWGGLPAHANYIADDVKGFIDRHYPTRGVAATAAIMGSSHGGLAAFWTATRRPDAFGKAGCLSPSFFTGIDSLGHAGPAGTRPVALADQELVADAAAVLADRARRPTIWLCWGLVRHGGEHNGVVEELATRRGREMAVLLEARFGYRHHHDLFVHEDAHGGHDEESWRGRFGRMMEAFFPPAR